MRRGKFEELQSLLHESPFVEDIEIKIIQTKWGEKRREESSQLSPPVNLLEHGSISCVSIPLMQFRGVQSKAFPSTDSNSCSSFSKVSQALLRPPLVLPATRMSPRAARPLWQRQHEGRPFCSLSLSRRPGQA